jgi:hypothetical protein
MTDTTVEPAPLSRPDQVRRYFTWTPQEPRRENVMPLAVVGAVLVAITLVVGISYAFSSANAGLLVAVPGALGLVALGLAAVWNVEYQGRNREYLVALAAAEPKPSDAQMTLWLAADIQRIVDHGHARLKLGSTPLKAVYPLVAPAPAGQPTIKEGHDGVTRFSAYHVLVAYLTTGHLNLYECDLDMATGSWVRGETKTFHAADVDSIETASGTRNLRLLSRSFREPGTWLSRPPTPEVRDTEQVRVVVRGRVASQITVLLGRFRRHSWETPSQLHVDRVVAELRTHLGK